MRPSVQRLVLLLGSIVVLMGAGSSTWSEVDSRPPIDEVVTWVAPDGTEDLAVDVAVIGSSSGGVGAAIGAARQGASVLLVSDVERLGGMLTNGVTTDLGDPSGSSGLFEEWRREIVDAYWWRGLSLWNTRGGYDATPSVALEALERLLLPEDVWIVTGWWVDHDDPRGTSVTADTIDHVTITDGRRAVPVRADVFIDATPEGDLLAAVGTAGVDFTWGREGQEVYAERLAPAESDRLSQAFNYRITAAVGAPVVPAPDGYDEWRSLYEQVPVGEDGMRCLVWDGPRPRLLQGGRIQRCLPGGLLDINIDLVGADHEFLEADRSQRAAIADQHRRFALGWLHHLATVHGWPIGLAEDEYDVHGGFPQVLYVREGRRLLGLETMTEASILHDDERAGRLSSVAVGDYGLDSHCVTGTVSGADCEGGFWVDVDRYEIPYEVMVPRRLRNLLAPVPVSASHVGYSSLRMEPVRMNLGFAAGSAAAQAVRSGVEGIADIDVRELQEVLVDAGQDLR